MWVIKAVIQPEIEIARNNMPDPIYRRFNYLGKQSLTQHETLREYNYLRFNDYEIYEKLIA